MNRETPYGKVLIEIEKGLLEHNVRIDEGIAKPYEYTDEQFRACLKIFMEAILWKMWQNAEWFSLEAATDIAEELGKKIREIVLDFTGIDTHVLWGNK